MRHPLTVSRVIALLVSLGVATACGPAATLRSSGAPATPATATPATATPATTAPATPAATSPRAGVKRADLLNGMSCAGQQCIAVGSYYDGTAASHTLVELWTGSAWWPEPSPDGPTYSSLQAVSCDVAAGCLAVGSLVIAGNGGRWRIVSPASTLDAVSCIGAGSCIAVGANTRAPLYASWNGRAWHTGTMHAPPQQAQPVTVAGVSCTSAANCMAVGITPTAPQRSQATAIGTRSSPSSGMAAVGACCPWSTSAGQTGSPPFPAHRQATARRSAPLLSNTRWPSAGTGRPGGLSRSPCPAPSATPS